MSNIEEEVFVFNDESLANMKFLGKSNKGCVNYIAKNNDDGIEVFVRKWKFDLDKLQFKCPISCQKIATKCDDHGHGRSNIETIIGEFLERTNFPMINVEAHPNLVHYISINTEPIENGKLTVYLAQEYIEGMSIKSWREKHGSIFVDQCGKCRVSDFHLVPYLMYLKSDNFLLNQCSDFEALASVIRSKNEANYQLANDFIDHCRSKELLFTDTLLKHSFISNALCSSDVKTNEDDRLLDHYDIQTYLGGGSFGQVFKARNQIDDRMYAIKLIPIPEKRRQRVKMDREVEVLSKLNYRYIVKYITSWKQLINLAELNKYIADEPPTKKRKQDNPRRLIIQMEIYSHNLRHEIQNGLHQSLDRIKKHFDEICLGLTFIHTSKVIHRDLKPEDILIDRSGHVKIGDFGLATTTLRIKQNQSQIYRGTVHNSQSQTGVVGTPIYIAPELLKGASKTLYWKKVDVYSLGIIFFEMLQPPFDNANYDEMITIFTDLRSSSIDMPKSFRENHPCEASLLLKMLDHNPKDRPIAKDIRPTYAKIRKTNAAGRVNEFHENELETMDWNEIFCDNF